MARRWARTPTLAVPRPRKPSSRFPAIASSPPNAVPSTAAVGLLAMLAWQSPFDARLSTEMFPTLTRPN
jgi:hypothetical protein